jgi:hypothetical protein
MNTGEIDQARTALLDHYPKMWKGLFDNLKAEGFTEQQALVILLTYITTSCKA